MRRGTPLADLLERRKALHQQIEDAEEKFNLLEDKLTELQPLANLGLAWAMTAHELNNLLMPILNYSQLALQNPDDKALCEKALQKSLLLSQRAGNMLEKIMAIAGRGQAEKEKLSLNQILDDVFVCIGRDFEKDKIRIIREIDESIQLWADATAIQQAFMNLILNARHALLEKGGQLKLTARQTTDGTMIQISDTGQGIAPEKLKEIFTPFYTSGKDNGNGLGLAFCRKVIEAHGGYIQADSKLNQGTTFKIMLPKYDI